ncbi:MAG: LTA synthase family protein [Ilumatobacteraceae bacterium]|nr:LTA synthase family protein [Ilumatobacteraceae bacterium]
MRRHFLTYLALSTMAIAQPILDLYGKNPTVFSAAKMSSLEVALFVLIIVLVPALLATGLDRLTRFLGPKVNEATRLWTIAGFSFLLGIAVARWISVDGNIGAFTLGFLFAAVVPIAYDRKKAIREWSRWLSVLAIAVTASAILQLQPILFQSDGPTSDAVIGNTDVSVLHIVFDEFPLYSLLSDDGTINATRYPGFAALARESTWYRNNVAESNFTHQAVPAILASAVPQQEGGPFLTQYPKNIFTLFSGKTSVGGIEPVTSLCPKSVCAGTHEVNALFEFSRFKSFMRDASYVYGQRVLPPVLRKYVPSIEGTWGGFGAVANKFKEQFDVGALSQVDAIANGTRALVEDSRSRVQVVHALAPHAPWRITPDDRVAPLSPSISTSNPESEDGVRDTYQTFLYQVAAADNAIADVISQLKKSGKWDKTMLVVTADHGISFVPTLPQRHTDFTEKETISDIYRIPTFIKYPQQSQAVVSDCAMSNLDLLPTIIETTGTKTSWAFGGKSVAQSCPANRVREVVSATGETNVMSGGFEEVLERVAYYANVVSNEGPNRRVAAIGSSASLIGSRIASSDQNTSVSSWTVNQKKSFTNVSDQRGAKVPSLVTGNVRLSAPLEVGTEGIIAINGVAAGVIGELSGARDVVPYTAILDYTLLTPGDHSVELFVRTPDGAVTKVGSPR